MNLKCNIIALIVLLILISSNSFGQVTADSLGNTNSQDTIVTKPLKEFIGEAEIEDKFFEMQKSPTTAIFLSILLPGAGQYYVESYWKVPIFLGAAGTLVYLSYDSHDNYMLFQNALDDINEDNPSYSRWKYERDYYLDMRDRFIFYLAGVYILSAIDAYVGSHLYDFNVDDDFTLTLLPNRNQGISVGLNFSW